MCRLWSVFFYIRDSLYERRVELERASFGHPEFLEDREVSYIGHGSLTSVARHIAEGRAEERLRYPAVHNEVNVVLRHRHRRSAGGDVDSLVQGVNADQ